MPLLLLGAKSKENGILDEEILYARLRLSFPKTDVCPFVNCINIRTHARTHTSTHRSTLLHWANYFGLFFGPGALVLLCSSNKGFGNPFDVENIPEDPCERARILLHRIGGKSAEVTDLNHDPVLLAAHSPKQRKLLAAAGERGTGVY